MLQSCVSDVLHTVCVINWNTLRCQLCTVLQITPSSCWYEGEICREPRVIRLWCKALLAWRDIWFYLVCSSCTHSLVITANILRLYLSCICTQRVMKRINFSLFLTYSHDQLQHHNGRYTDQSVYENTRRWAVYTVNIFAYIVSYFDCLYISCTVQFSIFVS